MKHLTVCIPEQGETRSAFLRRVRGVKGDVLVILPGGGEEFCADAKERDKLLASLKKLSSTLRIATRMSALVKEARNAGLRVIDRSDDLRHILQGHEKLHEALHAFSPNVWRQQLRSHLQSIGLLSLPRLRIWLLVIVSVILFLSVVFRLLPSATVTVVPREETVSQTANIFLVHSGAIVDIPPRVRKVALQPVHIVIPKTITFDQISKEFIGTNARVTMTVINKSDEPYKIRAGSRLTNQAGMIFRLQESVELDPGGEVSVLCIADDIDLYGEIIGERGNVPAGLKWDFPGLEPLERILVYAENRSEATGGKTLYRTVLKEGDLKAGERQLQEELLSEANSLIDEEIALHNAKHTNEVLTRLYYDELTKSAFSGFILPTQFLGERVASVPIEGSLLFTAYAYDAQYILTLLKGELAHHVEEGSRLLSDSVRLERLVTHVIDYADDLSWIKLTVDLSGTQQAVLDPLTPEGARFAREVRERVLGESIADAESIVKNLPEVHSARVSVWPPWNELLPTIPYHITVETAEK